MAGEAELLGLGLAAGDSDLLIVILLSTCLSLGSVQEMLEFTAGEGAALGATAGAGAFLGATAGADFGTTAGLAA